MMDLEPISPELALVSPELRERAIAVLPTFEFDRRVLPPRQPAVREHDPLTAVLAGICKIGLVAFVTCGTLVLILTAIANALR